MKDSVPFPQRFFKKKLDEKFVKFLEVFKKFFINIPFYDALEQMPNYAKFLEDLISKKRRIEGPKTVKFTEESSEILQRNLPKKLKDLGSFTLPCEIGGSFKMKYLCDLETSINLMSFSIFKRLDLEK
ncbi:hypothetical protein ACS0TY_021804 [Phlomoides rotata]